MHVQGHGCIVYCIHKQLWWLQGASCGSHIGTNITRRWLHCNCLSAWLLNSAGDWVCCRDWDYRTLSCCVTASQVAPLVSLQRYCHGCGLNLTGPRCLAVHPVAAALQVCCGNLPDVWLQLQHYLLFQAAFWLGPGLPGNVPLYSPASPEESQLAQLLANTQAGQLTSGPPDQA
jgi:hypothetical protein